MRAALSDICKQAIFKIFIFPNDSTNLKVFRLTETRAIVQYNMSQAAHILHRAWCATSLRPTQ